MRRLACWTVLLAAPLLAQAPNLLPNPGFEEVANARPAGWSANLFRTGGEARVETGGAHGGERCVALQSLDPTHRLAWYNAAPVLLPAGTRYVAAGGWYRTEGIAASDEKRGPSLRVHCYATRDGKLEEIGLRQDFFPASESWTRTPERFHALPAGTERVALQVFNWLTPGTTRWDDVWLRAASEQEIAALPDAEKPKLPPIPTVTLEAEAARLDPARVEVVAQDSFESKQGVALRAEQAGRVGETEAAPDLVFSVTTQAAGKYLLITRAAADARGQAAMRAARGKQDSLQLQLSIDGARRTKRVVFVPWSAPESCIQVLGKFDLSGQAQEIAVWLPEGVRLDFLRVAPYTPPAVPEAARAYRPSIVPPATRPRLWMNETTLPKIKANLDKAENGPAWARLQALADRPFEFSVAPGAEVSHNSGLETAAVAKAFVSLMTGEQKYGREAIALTTAYLSAVEFGNLLDITREIGRAIYSAALVYDWCYDLLTPPERDLLRTHMMRLAIDMEIGWPPFLQMVVNGHGNEAQVNRDLLAMSIALYDEDPLPYQYCAYQILEQLVPMRRFEYQSPRHNQGASYGPYRYSWDLHSALLFWRMSGQKVFDDNLGGVYYSWLYQRVPGQLPLRDGDGFSTGPVNYGLTPLLNYAYTGDPLVKWDFLRTNGLGGDPLMVLLLNDPDLKPAAGLDDLPLTKDFGPILSSMVARTGWNMGRTAGDVVVEMKGGGYNFGNHQHPDAGSFQIFYRGFQAADLGQYRFYGTPYDNNFTKRSISHSMLLVRDPAEKFAGTTTNDGGTRAVRACPATPAQATGEPLFANGKVLSSSFGPHPQRPYFSHFAVDLKSAYSDKIRSYVRSFCFLNLGSEQTPAALIVLDSVTSADPEFRKYWQMNSHYQPELTAAGATFRAGELGQVGRLDLHMLLPRPADRSAEVLSGPDASSVFGTHFEPPFKDRPEANGHRLMISPKTARTDDTFLTVLTMADEAAPAPAVQLAETAQAYTITLADRAVVLARDGGLLEQPFSITLPAGER
ncbi:MAG: hypothetical protein HUU35_07285, partial [Armatimonadetes bacterium]|nr:hypothetical protein [Armatimonadota bacterium]